MRFLLRFAGLSVFLLLLTTTEGLACSCLAPPTVPEEFAKSKNVLIVSLVGGEGIVDADGKPDQYGRSAAVMLIEKVYKGSLKADGTIKVFNGGGGDCTSGFQQQKIGDKFLLFFGDPGFGGHADLYVVGLCGRSKPLSAAEPDLIYLNNRATLEGKTRLSGSIRAVGENTELPSIAKLKVTVRGQNFNKELITDDHGFFDLWDIHPGVYALEFQRPAGWKFRGYQVIPSKERFGWIETTNNTIQVTILPGKHTELRSMLVIDNSISGTVLSPSGKPMKGVCVSAYWLTPTSDSYRIPDDCTDESGQFSIDQLPPGKYRVEINSRGRLSSSNPFETFYYPSTRNKDEAEPVTVGEGISARDLIIRIKETHPLIRISGVLQLKDGRPIGDTEVKFIPQDDDRYEEIETDTDGQGRFSFELPQGAAGQLRAEVNIFDSHFDKCPGIVSLRPFRTGKGPQSTFDFRIDGKTSKNDIRLIIHLTCVLN